jgi:tRNA (guanine10-N2)-methyltransferase
VSTSPSSALIHKYSLKSRAHIGNTSMSSDISLLMASQALAAPGKAVWDPFAGTGSMLLTCVEFGCVAWGSDIDGRQMRGVSSSTREKRLERARKEGISEGRSALQLRLALFSQRQRLTRPFVPADTPGILHSATQYGTKDRIIDLMTFDVTRNPFRMGQMFDACIPGLHVLHRQVLVG